MHYGAYKKGFMSLLSWKRDEKTTLIFFSISSAIGEIVPVYDLHEFAYFFLFLPLLTQIIMIRILAVCYRIF